MVSQCILNGRLLYSLPLGGFCSTCRLTPIIERMGTPVRHISYGIRHTALSSTYAIVAYVRHNNNAGSPVFGIPGLPIDPNRLSSNEAPACMEPVYYSPISLIQNTWM